MSKFANAGLLYERYYYYDLPGRKYFNLVDDKKKEDIAGPFFKKKNKALCDTVLQLPANAAPDMQHIILETIYPGLATGTGTTHETGALGEAKLGFYFDYTSGQPVIPGSSVKGALRSAFPQWSKHKNTGDEIRKVKTRYIHGLVNNIPFKETKPCTAEMIAAVTALEEELFEGKRDGKRLSCYAQDIFFDAVIVKASTHATTANKFLGTDSITPHGGNPLENPIPIPFIKILPGVQFQFRFRLHNGAAMTAAQKKSLFTTLLTTHGIGAKTNVGYGQLTPVKQ
jgi:CRISPR-associated protein Cmr6